MDDTKKSPSTLRKVRVGGFRVARPSPRKATDSRLHLTGRAKRVLREIVSSPKKVEDPDEEVKIIKRPSRTTAPGGLPGSARWGDMDDDE